MLIEVPWSHSKIIVLYENLPECVLFLTPGGQTLPVPQPDENPYLQIIGGSGSITAGGGAGGEIPEPSRWVYLLIRTR